MADSTIGVEESAAPTKLLDTTSLTVGLDTVERERMQVAGGAATELAEVKAAAPATNLMGLVVRLVAEAIGGAIFTKVTDGTDTALVTAAGELSVLDSNSAAALALLTTIDADTGNLAAILTALAIMDDWDNAASDGASVSGDTAHDAADAGEPVKIGGYAKAAAPTDVSADADRVNAWFLLNGAQATVLTAAGALIGGDAANGLDVDVTRSALPTGAATSAKQDTEIASLAAIDTDLTTVIGHVDGIETVLGTIDTDTGAMVTDLAAIEVLLTTIDGRVDGLEALLTTIDADTGNLAAILTALQLIDDLSTGMTIFRSIDIDESEEEIKATAGRVHTITAFNTTAAPLYLKFYNLTAANTTVGTSTPVLTFLVPGNADSDGAGFVLNSERGWVFGTAITVACTTAIADADTGAPGANACLINIGYI